MQKTVLFAFNGDPLCFVHVLLNALDLNEAGQESGIVFEGQSVTLVGLLARPEHPFHGLYAEAKEKGLLLGVCKACAVKLDALAAVNDEGLPLISDMRGHASMRAFLEAGSAVITF